jgi:hypothetical protein
VQTVDEREKVEEQVADLEVEAQDADGVKGGGGVTAMDDWEAPVARSVKAGPGRTGVDPQHNETHVVI